jgi:hypothetical protein
VACLELAQVERVSILQHHHKSVDMCERGCDVSAEMRHSPMTL